MNNPSEEQISFWKYLLKPRPILDFFRATIYLLFAILFMMMPDFLTDLPLYRYLFCGAAFLYSLYRYYRIYAEYKQIYS